MKQPSYVLYDDRCPICQGARRWIEARDPEHRRFVFQGIHHSPQLLTRYPQLTPEALQGEMHVVTPDGEIVSGSRAVRQILSALPRWRRLSPLFRLPGMPWLADRLYWWVAANRYRISAWLKPASCRLPPPEQTDAAPRDRAKE